MLESLAIENYAVAKKVFFNLNNGMSAITGETGAGKSIAIDALQLVLGGRADAKSVRTGATETNICATFNLCNANKASSFLDNMDLLSKDESEKDLCIIRRIIKNDGKSRAYINDKQVNSSVLKELAPMLINIHGQNDGQLLLKQEHQLAYLDAYGQLQNDVNEVTDLYAKYSHEKKALIELKEEQDKKIAEFKLAKYQLAELDSFAPKENEFLEISQEYDLLNHAETIMTGVSTINNALTDDDESISNQLNTVLSKIYNLTKLDNKLNEMAESINNAKIIIDDTANELTKYIDKIEVNPERSNQISERMQAYTDLAHKYDVTPNELTKVFEELKQKVDSFANIKNEIEQKTQKVLEIKNLCLAKANELSHKRQEVAIVFADKVAEMLHSLSMPHAIFNVAFEKLPQPTSTGIDSINFLFNANLGMTPDLLSKTASGGEISRIALSILVLTANKISAPTLIFDEIDTGISGQTAAITGSLLRSLGKSSQVITVTHLPQVAASAHNQYEVKKETKGNETFSSIMMLDEDGRINEIARLLGSDHITESALVNAKELISRQAKD